MRRPGAGLRPPGERPAWTAGREDRAARPPGSPQGPVAPAGDVADSRRARDGRAPGGEERGAPAERRGERGAPANWRAGFADGRTGFVDGRPGGRAPSDGRRLVRDAGDGRARAADDALIEQTIGLLRAHDRRDYSSRFAIGQHVFETYFGGDEALARAKDRDKPASFNALERRARDETSWSGADLARAVLLFLVSQSLEEGLAEKIPPSYIPKLDAVEEPMRTVLARRMATGELQGRAAIKAITAAAGIPKAGKRAKPRALAGAIELERLGRQLASEQAFEAEAWKEAAAVWLLDEAVAVLSAHLERVKGFVAAARTAGRRPRAGEAPRSSGKAAR